MNDGGGNGTGDCGIKARVDTVKLSNTVTAVFKEMRSGPKRQAVYQR